MHLHDHVFRIVSLLLFAVCCPGLARAQGEDFRYLHIEILAPSNAQISEGLFPRSEWDPSAPPSGASDPHVITTLLGTLDLSHYRLFNGVEGMVPAGWSGDLLLSAAKDGSFAAHASILQTADGMAAEYALAVLVNSRERMTYDLSLDTFYYGNKAMNFPRDSAFTITFSYGGWFSYIDPEHFEIMSASGVKTSGTILTVPEPATVGLLAGAGLALLGARRRRRAAG